MQISDQKLVKDIKASDAKAFQVLYNRYYENLYRFTWRRVRDKDLALDLIQEVFTKTWQNRNSLDATQSIKAFLFRSVINLSIDHLRKQSVRNTVPLEFSPEPESDQEERSIDFQQAFDSALQSLTDKQREVFIMRHVDGLKYEEIADILNLSVKAIEKRMTKTLKILRENMCHLLSFIVALKIIFLR